MQNNKINCEESANAGTGCGIKEDTLKITIEVDLHNFAFRVIMDRQNLVKPFPGHPYFFELLGKMAYTHITKNLDYSGEDGRPLKNLIEGPLEFNMAPVSGIHLKMHDNWSRIKVLNRRSGKHFVLDEPLEDSYLDLSVYSLLALCLLQDQINKPPTVLSEEQSIEYVAREERRL